MAILTGYLKKHGRETWLYTTRSGGSRRTNWYVAGTVATYTTANYDRTQALVLALDERKASDDHPTKYAAGYFLNDAGDLFRGETVDGDREDAEREARSLGDYWYERDREDDELAEAEFEAERDVEEYGYPQENPMKTFAALTLPNEQALIERIEDLKTEGIDFQVVVPPKGLWYVTQRGDRRWGKHPPGSFWLDGTTSCDESAESEARSILRELKLEMTSGLSGKRASASQGYPRANPNPMHSSLTQYLKTPMGAGLAIGAVALLAGGAALLYAKSVKAAQLPSAPSAPQTSLTPVWTKGQAQTPTVGQYVILQDARTTPATNVLVLVQDIQPTGVMAGEALNYWIYGPKNPAPAPLPGQNLPEPANPGSQVFFTAQNVTAITDASGNPISGGGPVASAPAPALAP